ncbi:MAG: solute carrier family 23 protein, partial [Gemmiger sp.]
MSQLTSAEDKTLFEFRGKIPPAKQLIPLGLQHVVAAVVGVITPAIIISGTCGLAAEEKTLLIQASLVMTAVATLLQLFPVFHKIGAGLPVIMGTSFAYVPTLTAIGAEFGLPTILGAEIIGGLVAVVFGVF